MNKSQPEAEKVILKQQMGARIKKLRIEASLSQRRLSTMVGQKSATFIALLESGKRNISAITLINLAEALKVNCSAIIEVDTDEKDFVGAIRRDTSLSTKDRRKVEEYYFMLKNKNEK